MKHEIDFEATDWEAEFERIKRAFGVIGECEILNEDDYLSLEVKGGNDDNRLPLYDGSELVVGFSLKNKTLGFCLFVDDIFTELTLGKNYEWVFAMYGCVPHEDISSLPLARGLFHLGVLTCEVETEMNLTISEHQKMEWTLEYEARNDL